MVYPLAIYVASLALGPPPPVGGIGCSWQNTPLSLVRVFLEENTPGVLNSEVCTDPKNIDMATGAQRAFLVQYQSSTLSDRGFYTLAGPFSENMAVDKVTLARIAATGAASSVFNNPITNPDHRRFYTPLDSKKLEIVIEVENGSDLKISHRNNDFIFGEEAVKLVARDFSNRTLALSTKVSYANGQIEVSVCAPVTCLSYLAASDFGYTTPEIYLGDRVQGTALANTNFRARYFLADFGTTSAILRPR